MIRQKIFMILSISIICICFAACGAGEAAKTVPSPPASESLQTEGNPSETPNSESLPVMEEIPVPEPEPTLHEPLWNGMPEVQHTRDIQRNEDMVSIFETMPNDHIQLRLYQMENGDRVTMGRLENTAGETEAYTWTNESGGTIRWYSSSAGQWQEQPIAPGQVDYSMIELTLDNGSSFLIYLPKTYRLRENGVLEYLPEQDGRLNIVKTGDSWRFSLMAQLPDQGCVSDFTMVQGWRPMLNWTHSYCGDLWKNYTMETEGKWCFDGYYWPCPGNYVPTGANYLYACPAAYLVKSFAYTASVHPAADDLALAMLDTMSLQQNDSGFWPTSPRSDWLYADYGVDRGFYDTRFNTDLIEIYRIYYAYAGGDVLRDTMERYLAFFTGFAEQAHFASASGGWFIPDYAPAATAKPHCSLNHQLAECIELYHLAEILERPDLEALADRMLLAITDTRDQWINETGDLHYCVFPDGSFGMQDYPYLTYNDLLELQNLLTARRGVPDDTLQYLMDQKRQWMDANGITAYNQ